MQIIACQYEVHDAIGSPRGAISLPLSQAMRTSAILSFDLGPSRCGPRICAR